MPRERKISGLLYEVLRHDCKPGVEVRIIGEEGRVLGVEGLVGAVVELGYEARGVGETVAEALWQALMVCSKHGDSPYVRETYSSGKHHMQ